MEMNREKYRSGKNENLSLKKELENITGSRKSFYDYFLEQDQKLNWNYEDKNLDTNRIKEILEKIDGNLESEKFREEKYHTLWLWYHHASQYAFHQKKDAQTAISFIEKALKYHPLLNHPNKITELLYYLYHQDFQKAKEYLSNLDGYELETAKNLLKDFEKTKK